MIHTLPNVRINGKNNIFGGYIYNLSYQIGFSSEPSQMIVSLLSEDGNYSKPTLGYNHPYTIQIGSENYTMYAYEDNLVEDNSGNILEVKFEDPTSCLNQFFVGLKNKHGTGSSKCIIIVGDEILPGEGEQIDACAANSNDNVIQATIDYSAISLTNIFEVDYSFNQLLTEMGNVGIKVESLKSKNPLYRNRYVGKLRDVLNSWCADYGYNYYYDHSRKEIKFVDISAGINIKFNEPSNEKLISKKTKRTLKGTATKGAISYFAAEGQSRCLMDNGQKGFKADFTRVLNGYPITPDLLFPYGNLNVPPSHLTTSCALSAYSSAFRDAYYLYDIYQIQNGPNSNKVITIPEVGNTTIFKMVSATSISAEDQSTYNDLLDNLPPHIKDNPAFSETNLHFCAMYKDEDLLQQQYSKENTIAKDILGRYWFANYGVTNIKVDKGPPKIVSEGTSIYYDSKIAGSTPFFIEIGGFNYLLNVGLTRFILTERSTPSWFPNDSELQVLHDKWAGYMPAELSNVTENISDYFKPFTSFAVNDPRQIKIYAILFPPEAPGVTIAGGTHPNESDPQPYRNGNGATYLYGVLNKGTNVMNFDGTNLYLPVGSFGADLNQYHIIVEDALGYLNTCKTLPKIETVYTDVSCDKTVENLEINLLDISTLDLELYLYDSSVESCRPNFDKIEKLHEELNKDLTYSTPNEFKEITYTIGGLPDNIPSIEDGLLSFEISINAEQGIQSTITVGNSAATPPPLDYALAKSQFSTNQSKVQFSKTLNYNKLNIDVS